MYKRQVQSESALISNTIFSPSPYFHFFMEHGTKNTIQLSIVLIVRGTKIINYFCISLFFCIVMYSTRLVFVFNTPVYSHLSSLFPSFIHWRYVNCFSCFLPPIKFAFFLINIAFHYRRHSIY